jgi:NAD kinase
MENHLYFERDEDDPDFYILAGGDGTVFYHPNKIAILENEKPVYQVHIQENTLKSVGFWPDVDLDQLPTALYDIEKGNYIIEYEELLEVKVDGRHMGYVINEIDLEHRDRSRVYQIETVIERPGVRQPYGYVRLAAPMGDILLIGTKRGSSAWKASYGGDINLDSPGIDISNIGTSIKQEKYHADINDIIHLKFHTPYYATIDSVREETVEGDAGSTMEIKRADKHIGFIRTDNTYEEIWKKIKRQISAAAENMVPPSETRSHIIGKEVRSRMRREEEKGVEVWWK